MSTTTDTSATGTYKGKTAQEWRDQAARSHKLRDESWERSDSDGYVTQWSLGLSSSQYTLSAQLAEANGFTETKALFDLDGNLVPAYHGDGQYGTYWSLLDDEGNWQNQYFSPSKAKNETMRRANNAKKGFYVGTVKVPGTVKLCGIPNGAKGLSGAASAYYAICPANGFWFKKADFDEYEIVDNGK